MSHAEAVKAALTFCEHCDREWNDGTAGALDPEIDTVEAVCAGETGWLRRNVSGSPPIAATALWWRR